jgi:Tol biopolymer transport system component
MHPDGSALHRLVSAGDGLVSTQPFWSRDSDQLLFKRFTDNPGLVDLWSVNVDGSKLHQVTHVPAEYRGLAWLP